MGNVRVLPLYVTKNPVILSNVFLGVGVYIPLIIRKLVVMVILVRQINVLMGNVRILPLYVTKDPVILSNVFLGVDVYIPLCLKTLTVLMGIYVLWIVVNLVLV